MIDTDKYEDAKKMVEDAGLIDDNDGWLDVHYRKIAHLLTEVKQLREWKAKVERICRTVYGPNRDTALFMLTNEVES
jgi:hypothetical protein|tara:strand:- start:202 stop:432 length:231 start_codon:yes stop_codon:yes gene_type:complete